MGSRHKSSTRFSNEAAVWYSSLCIYLMVSIALATYIILWWWWWFLPPHGLLCGFHAQLGPARTRKPPRPREKERSSSRTERKPQKKMIGEYEGRSRCGSRHVRLSLSACRRACLTPPPRFCSYAIKASQVETLSKWDRRSRSNVESVVCFIISVLCRCFCCWLFRSFAGFKFEGNL